MKCDELKPLVFSINKLSFVDESAVQKNFENPHDHAVYKATEVDDAIAELKRKMQDQCISCPVKMQEDDVVAEKDNEIRRLKRALWLARADRAIMTLDYFTLKCRWFKDYMKVEPPGCDVKMVHKWANIERKCRAKAEEYK